MGVGGGVRPPMHALDAAIAALEAFPVPDDPEELHQSMIELRPRIDRLRLVYARLTRKSVELESWDGEAVSPVQWMRNNCKMSTGEAMDLVHLGGEMDEVPESVAALNRGEIGFQHLVLIAETGAFVRRAERPLEEEKLLALAREKTVTQFRDACHHIHHAADPDLYAADEVDAKEEVYFEVRMTDHGGANLRGYLDMEGAAALKEALAPLARHVGEDDFRTVNERNADALVELALHALSSETIPGRPHLQVTASVETLQGLLGSPAGEMEFSIPISAKTVQRIACDCSLTRVIFGADSQVIDVGRSRSEE